MTATLARVHMMGHQLILRAPYWLPHPWFSLLLCLLSGTLWQLPFGRTEVIDNTLNPDFVRKFVLDFFFEEKQNLRFDVYNVDSRSSNISKHDFLGQTFCTLGEIIGSTGSRLEKTLS
ncbi:hypothetical protein SKAU_G00096860 [Synaphobranchus kaupii]|uniref:C2 domain-containing protein n=1 Tax=Synaphobranchus kaupii TaxID=118154 RepID=A0A9Q1FYM2_SYNKA|nr:hypothetical protein SKAU_G00096860 [Synaphobranchus kaupii]